MEDDSRIGIAQKLATKEGWERFDPAIIAAYFGFADDENFRRAFKDFIKNTVDLARIGDFLPILATRHFNKWAATVDSSC